MSAFKRIDHVAVHCSDLARSSAFYADVLGFEPWVGHDNRIQYFRLGGTLIELTLKSPAQQMSGTHFCLETDDLNAATEHLRARGVPFVVEPRPATPRIEAEAGIHRIMVEGPDGELIEVRGPWSG